MVNSIITRNADAKFSFLLPEITNPSMCGSHNFHALAYKNGL